jgi:hypothetical protein
MKEAFTKTIANAKKYKELICVLMLCFALFILFFNFFGTSTVDYSGAGVRKTEGKENGSGEIFVTIKKRKPINAFFSNSVEIVSIIVPDNGGQPLIIASMAKRISNDYFWRLYGKRSNQISGDFIPKVGILRVMSENNINDYWVVRLKKQNYE